jgi:hypothetical protein
LAKTPRRVAPTFPAGAFTAVNSREGTWFLQAGRAFLQQFVQQSIGSCALIRALVSGGAGIRGFRLNTAKYPIHEYAFGMVAPSCFDSVITLNLDGQFAVQPVVRP